VRDLGDAQARTVGDAERGLILDAGCRLEQARGLLDAQHIGQLAGMPHDHQRAREIAPPQRHREQEAQRRHRAVDGRWSDPALMLMELEAPDILCGRRVGRTAQERREPPNITDIVLLRMRAGTAHQHIVRHAPA